VRVRELTQPRWAQCILLGLLVPVAGGKWGSYLGIASVEVFLSDTLLAAGLIGLLVCSVSAARSTGVKLSQGQFGLLLLVALFAITEFSSGAGSSVTRLRDLAPFFYLMLLPFVVGALRELKPASVVRRLDGALTVHAIWCVPAFLGVLPPISIAAIGGFPVFATRPDIDVPLLAALTVFTLPRRISSVGLRCAVVVLIAGAALTQSSRAALGGSLVGAAVYVLFKQRSKLQGLVRLSSAAAVALAVLVGVQLLAGPKLISSGAVGRAGLVGGDASSAATSGQGTAQARYVAWDLVLADWKANGSPALGERPGTEIVRDSGALTYLSGDPSVRAPHDWWVGCLARFGPVGLLLWLAMALSALSYRRSIVSWPSGISRKLFAMSLALVASLLVASTLGVVIEAPFGSQILVLALALAVTAGAQRGESHNALPNDVGSRATI